MFFSKEEIISLSVLFIEETEKAEFNRIDLTCKCRDFYKDVKEFLRAESEFMGLFTGVMYLCSFHDFICTKPLLMSDRVKLFDDAKNYLIEHYKLLNLESYGDYAQWKKQQDS